jgi:RHS repeat-associated protein
VGNRKQMASTLAPVPAGLWNYDANERFTAGDTYDNNGNTASSGGIANVYDFENHLIQKGGATIVYDGDGNRVDKTAAGVTTTYLVDTLNPTGYAQVLAETISGPGNSSETRTYAYGLELISQHRQFFNSQNFTQTSYYVYDGNGSVRALTDPSGAVTDTYDYDTFGNLIHQTGTTPNNYLFAGEQYDADLNLYYNRARSLNATTGRFWTMDDGYLGERQSACQPASGLFCCNC